MLCQTYRSPIHNKSTDTALHRTISLITDNTFSVLPYHRKILVRLLYMYYTACNMYTDDNDFTGT